MKLEGGNDCRNLENALGNFRISRWSIQKLNTTAVVMLLDLNLQFFMAILGKWRLLC